MKKNIIIAVFSLITIVLIFTIVLNNLSSKSNDYKKFVEKKAEDLNPISKESAIKILEAEFGKDIANIENDFKEEGNYYIINVNINLVTSEEHTHTEEELSTEGLSITDDGDHIISLGIYKINKYTGELIEN